MPNKVLLHTFVFNKVIEVIIIIIIIIISIIIILINNSGIFVG